MTKECEESLKLQHQSHFEIMNRAFEDFQKMEEMLLLSKEREKILYSRLSKLVTWVYANNEWGCLPLEIAHAQAALTLLKKAYDT
jgi:hypothetical protein